MFGVSFTELVVVSVVALVVLGPDRLPGVMRTLGQWIGKLRRLSSEMRAQSGIDELLRKEGIAGGLSELRAVLRRDVGSLTMPTASGPPVSAADPYVEGPEVDTSRERPPEGPDSYGAMADDLVQSPTWDATKPS